MIGIFAILIYIVTLGVPTLMLYDSIKKYLKFKSVRQLVYSLLLLFILALLVPKDVANVYYCFKIFSLSGKRLHATVALRSNSNNYSAIEINTIGFGRPKLYVHTQNIDNSYEIKIYQNEALVFSGVVYTNQEYDGIILSKDINIFGIVTFRVCDLYIDEIRKKQIVEAWH